MSQYLLARNSLKPINIILKNGNTLRRYIYLYSDTVIAIIKVTLILVYKIKSYNII